MADRGLKLGRAVWVKCGRYKGRCGYVVCNLPQVHSVSVNFDGFKTDNDVTLLRDSVTTFKREVTKHE